MADKEFAFSVTQDEGTVPKRHSLDANTLVLTLDGSKVSTTKLEDGLYILDTGAVGVKVASLNNDLRLVNLGGRATSDEVKAAVLAYSRMGTPAEHEGAGSIAKPEGSTLDTADGSKVEPATALDPGVWTKEVV